jgi:hypothetical protein
MLNATNKTEIEVLGDKVDSVAFGWVAQAVLYTRFQGGFTAPIGQVYAARLSALVAQSQSLCFFCDSSELKSYDVLARSSFARVILSNRRKFSSIVMLAWTEGVSHATQALVTTIGEPIEVLTNRNAFEVQLLRKAPLALRKVDSADWGNIARPTSATRK